MTGVGIDRPGVQIAACLASTLDGRLGHPQIPVIGSDGDRQRLETLRAQADVLLYGAGTARADSRRRIEFRYPEIGRPVVSRLGLPVPPMAVLFRDTTFDFTSPFWTTPTRKALLHAPAESTASAGPAGLPADVDYLLVSPPEPTRTVAPRYAAMSRALTALARWLTKSTEPAPHAGDAVPGRGPVRVLYEGGGALVAALLEADLLDELFLTLTGWIAGDDEATPLTVGGTLGQATGARHLTLDSASVVSSTSEVSCGIGGRDDRRGRSPSSDSARQACARTRAPVRSLRPPAAAVAARECRRGGSRRRRTAPRTLVAPSNPGRAAGRRRAERQRGTDVYGYPADVLTCGRCGSLCRDPGSVPADIQQRYRDDPYPPETLDRLFGRYTDSYRRDHRWMRQQLTPPPGALTARARPTLLEVGSHVGAFIAYASGFGWSAHGLDVGTAVTDYARSRGADARVGEFAPARYPAGGLDAVWILNCFEHLPNPAGLLVDVHRILRPYGRLVLRTPRAEGIHALYAARPRPLAQTVLTQDNALGVPFPHCYSEHALTALLLAAGFQTVEVRRRRLVAVGPEAAGLEGLTPPRAAARAAAVRAGLWAWRHSFADPPTWMDISALAAGGDGDQVPSPADPRHHAGADRPTPPGQPTPAT